MRECVSCGIKFGYDEEQCKWDYTNYTPAKIVRCPYCDCTQAVSYDAEEDLNQDERFFLYKHKYNK